jgi:hypothetical protein
VAIEQIEDSGEWATSSTNSPTGCVPAPTRPGRCGGFRPAAPDVAARHPHADRPGGDDDLPPQPKAFVPDYHPEEIAKIASTLRTAAGLPKEPSGEVNVPAGGEGVVDKVKGAIG